MEENMGKGQEMGMSQGKNGNYCNCRMCRYGHGHFVMRWVLGIIILLVVFCMGVMVGHHGGGEFGHRGFGGQMRGYGNQMMRGNPQDSNWGAMDEGADRMMQPQATTTPTK